MFQGYSCSLNTYGRIVIRMPSIVTNRFFYINIHEENFTLDVDSDKWVKSNLHRIIGFFSRSNKHLSRLTIDSVFSPFPIQPFSLSFSLPLPSSSRYKYINRFQISIHFFTFFHSFNIDKFNDESNLITSHCFFFQTARSSNGTKCVSSALTFLFQSIEFLSFFSFRGYFFLSSAITNQFQSSDEQ